MRTDKPIGQLQLPTPNLTYSVDNTDKALWYVDTLILTLTVSSDTTTYWVGEKDQEPKQTSLSDWLYHMQSWDVV